MELFIRSKFSNGILFRYPFLVLILLLIPLFILAQSSQNITIQINPQKTHQTIEGFGSCFVTFADTLEEYKDPAFWDLVVDDLGMSLARIPMPEHMERNNDNDDPDQFNWDGYYLKNNASRAGIERAMDMLLKLKSRGVNRFMATPWSPPDFMKTNRSPIMGGHLRADMLEEYAEYMAAYIILAKQNWGIDIGAISIQNELLFIEPYRSCIYHPEMAREAVRALMHKFEKENINTRIIMPEDMMFYGRMMDYITPTMQDPETKQFNGDFATHRQQGGETLTQWAKAIEPFNRQTWMTETSGHQQTWEGAMALGEDLYEYLELGNFSAWIYWQISDDAGSGKYALMVDGQPTSKYYISKHFYRYIRPGAKRVNSSMKDETVLTTSYIHPVTGALTTVIINNGSEVKSVELSVNGINELHQLHWYQTTENESFRNMGSLDGSSPVITMPAKSIATITGHHPSFKTKDQMAEWPEAWKIPEENEAVKWGNFKEPLYTEDWRGFNIMNSVEDAIRDGNINRKLISGQSLLHQALLAGNYEAVDKLLDNGADVNLPDEDGWTPLHMAAGIFHLEGDATKYELFKRVMEAGPDVHATTDDGITPLHSAVMNAHTAWRQDPEDNIQRIQHLIDAGANLHVRDNAGRTPLHWAAWQGYSQLNGTLEVRSDVTEVLLKNGAKVNLKDDMGRTPLHYAAEMGYAEIVYTLLQAGASADIKDNNQQSAFELAENRALNDILYIISNKAMPDKPMEDAAGTSIDGGNGKLGPELLKAAWNGETAKVSALLEQGADIHYMDSDGFKPIDRARDNGHDEIVKMLKKAEK